MKKFKEKLQKITKNKIFIALFMLTLTLFSILSPLNGVNSGNIKADALSAPSTKTLNLNGVRYEYQTSLNELKNNYGLFNNELARDLIVLSEQESLVRLDLLDYAENSPIKDNTVLVNAINELIEIKDTNGENKNLDVEISYIEENGIEINDIKEINLMGLDNLNFDDITFNLQNISSINFGQNIKFNPANFDGALTINFVFLATNYVGDTKEGLKENSIIKSYAFNKSINYSFNVIKETPKGYTPRLIYICYENDIPSVSNAIYSRVPNQYNDTHKSYLMDSYITIDNLTFYDNDLANIISFNLDYSTGEDDRRIYPLFKGNLLLSTNKADNEMLSFIHRFSSPVQTHRFKQVFDTKLYFGGYNAEANVNNVINYNQLGQPVTGGPFGYTIQADKTENQEFPINKDVMYTFYGSNSTFTDLKIDYNGQNQLLYVDKISPLRASLIAYPNVGDINQTYNGSGLSAQVDNVLYGVTLAGNIQEITKNENIQEDFLNMLKTGALGTLIGLFIGLITGNPALGAGIGGAGGLLIGVIPLIIDAFSNVVGNSPALNIIYNLFKSITMLFVDIFNAIINFLINFITNPIVLIVVVIAILVYIFVIRKIKK